MLRTRVVSSALVSIGYDEVNLTVEVEFHTGDVFQYFPVPRTVFEELMASQSKGAYFDTRIKGHFIFRRVS